MSIIYNSLNKKIYYQCILKNYYLFSYLFVWPGNLIYTRAKTFYLNMAILLIWNQIAYNPRKLLLSNRLLIQHTIQQIIIQTTLRIKVQKMSKLRYCRIVRMLNKMKLKLLKRKPQIRNKKKNSGKNRLKRSKRQLKYFFIK